jgi:MFS transporter, NRE family, putaive nickel resistance protein
MGKQGSGTTDNFREDLRVRAIVERFLPSLDSLKNPVFARLYLAQTISLLGDALTWVGLALLAFQLAGKDSALVLSAALTLRVTAFVFLSPLAGVLADRLDRKLILVVTHLVRMVIVGLLPFVGAVWQIYVLIFALNAFNAFFTPTYQATVPLVVGKDDYPQALALSSATYELLGVLGPGIAGGVAVLIGARQIFFLDALSFLVAAILIFSLPGQMQVTPDQSTEPTEGIWHSIQAGTARLFTDSPIRYALAMELVAAVIGAQILVNTVGYLKGELHQGDVQYGWVMGAFGIGATLAALAMGTLDKKLTRTNVILLGAVLTTFALLPANAVGFVPLLGLWLLAGAGQNWVNLPTQTLIAERIPSAVQGGVYGAHFAWSHLWWALAYPLAGWLGSTFPGQSFFYGGLIGLGFLAIVQLALAPQGVLGWVFSEHEHEIDEPGQPIRIIRHRHFQTTSISHQHRHY